MFGIEKPNIQCVEKAEDNSFGRFVIEPLERGYGITLGNALRRVLLSSLPGAAVTAVKIDGILHEFSTAPGVVEDIADIILNLKGLSIKMHTDEPRTIIVDAKGEGVVYASDIITDQDVEILNPDHYIATLESDGVLHMEISICKGRGYVSADKNKREDQPIGLIPIDSLFSPVIKVNFTVEDTRVGQQTDYDKLTIDVLTDKTIAPDEAISSSAQILSDYLNLFIGLTESVPQEVALIEKEDSNEDNVKRLNDIKERIASLTEQETALKAKWKEEKSSLDHIKELKNQKNKLVALQDKYMQEGNLQEASKLQYGDIPKITKEIADLEAKESDDALLQEKVTVDNVSEVISRWTGIPMNKLMASEREKLLALDDTLKVRVIGQDDAITKVTDAILRSRAGINDEEKPIGSFLFLGPTGVGKTEVAKALAEQLFDTEKNIVRIDMSEYMEKFSVSRLVGAPPGYVGYEEGGQLTEAVRRHPYSIVLLDEIEKAHPDVFNILLQVLDDGRITDSKGNTVSFKNTIIIMTSNIGSQYLLEGNNEENRKLVKEELKAHFKPEFLNRIDEIVMFNSLDGSVVRKIIDKFIGQLVHRLQDKKITISLTDQAYQMIQEEGFDPIYGARPLKRFIQSQIETKLAKEIIKGTVHQGQHVEVDYQDGFVLKAQ